MGRAIVPSGASTGRHEIPEWRDGGTRMGGLGVRGAVGVIRTQVRAAIMGVAAGELGHIDSVLRAINAPAERGHLGSNTTLAVSVAAARAAAAAAGVPLWRLLDPGEVPLLPMPMIQILAGGAHAGGVIDVQDVLALPIGATTFAEAIELIWRVRASATSNAAAAGHATRLSGDEGGMAIPFRSNRAAVAFVAAAIDDAGLEGRVVMAIDVAAGQLVTKAGRYRLAVEDRTLDRDEWIDELSGWVRDLPLLSIEDPIDEDDWDGWQAARKSLGVDQLVGDDLFVTDLRRLARGIDEKAANAVLIKPNQCGTLTDAARVLREGTQHGWRTIVSARSGESEDDWLSDLAVGWRAGQIKVGSLARSDRTAKWNRLLEIEATMPSAEFARPFATTR
jgi:enolase